MERVEIEGQVATAHTMAMLFSAIPPSRSGPVDIFIVDIHALQERFYFDPRSSIVNPISAIPIFITRLMAKFVPPSAPLTTISFCNKQRLSPRYPAASGSPPIKFAFPDEGAFKRFGKPLTAPHCTATATSSSVARWARFATVFILPCSCSPSADIHFIKLVFPLAFLADTRGRRPPHLDH